MESLPTKIGSTTSRSAKPSTQMECCIIAKLGICASETRAFLSTERGTWLGDGSAVWRYPLCPDSKGKMIPMKTEGGLKGLWHAFMPGGKEESDGVYANASGNLLGSWVMRINYDADT